MDTIIELYDPRPLLNVLSTEMFRPARTVFLCPPEIGRNAHMQRQIRAYFRHRDLAGEVFFVPVDMVDAAQVERALRETIARYPDCAIDIAGGTDAAQFAAGLLCASSPSPVFTYSRKQNTFYNIRNAPFAHELPCDIRLCVEDCFLMAGGELREGRMDNAALRGYFEDIRRAFAIYLKYRREWPSFVTYMQRASQTDPQGRIPLEVSAPWQVKGEHGGRISASADILRALCDIGMLSGLVIRPRTSVRFVFRDLTVRKWLRDVGSLLELFTYLCCVETGLFYDVRVSAVVDWHGGAPGPDSVTNEIDVMATRGVRTYFISCKTGEVKTEALNELAILRDRFGGDTAKAAIVTASKGGKNASSMRQRAAELGISVIDGGELSAGRLPERLRMLAK